MHLPSKLHYNHYLHCISRQLHRLPRQYGVEASDNSLVPIDPDDLPANMAVLTLAAGYQGPKINPEDEPDINPEEEWIDKPFYHPFDQAECPAALPSSPHPSQIMAAYYDPVFDVIE
jgi:hypothetical protein